MWGVGRSDQSADERVVDKKIVWGFRRGGAEKELLSKKLQDYPKAPSEFTTLQVLQGSNLHVAKC